MREGIRMLLEGFPDLDPLPWASGADSAAFRERGDSILRVIAGRVVKIRGTADRLGILTQLGILPDIG